MQTAMLGNRILFRKLDSATAFRRNVVRTATKNISGRHGSASSSADITTKIMLFGTTTTATAATIAATSVTWCDDTNTEGTVALRNSDQDNVICHCKEEAIHPDDEFYFVPKDFVPQSYSAHNTTMPMDHVLGPCDESWKRFEMCIGRYVDDVPVPDYGSAEQRCMKYGLPLMNCFHKNHDGIMKRYATGEKQI